jgi:anti-sigma factor RsiW
MMTCEDHEILISTFLDGELSREEAGVMLDHLIGCESCRAFYRAAQGLQEAVQPLVSGHRNPPPVELWERIESRSRPRRFLSGRFQGVADWGWKAAAVLLVVFGLWQIGRIRTGSGPGAPGPGSPSPQTSERVAAPGAAESTAPAPGLPVEVVLGGAPGRMTDARFRELTTELLGADHRYHQAMLQVMREVQKSTRSQEAPPEEILRDPRHGNGEPAGESPRGLPS